MNQADKLRVLIPYWIEHNTEHADESRRWAKRAGDAAPDILATLTAIARANESLATALEKLGGALSHHAPEA